MVQLNFNATNVQPMGSFTVLESGLYDVMITASQLKPTKAKLAGTAQKGSILELTYKIASGERAGSTYIDRINMENDNQTAVDIGQQQLSSICRVTGVLHLQDTQQLHGIPFKVQIVKSPRTDDPNKFNNNVEQYLSINGVTADQVPVGGAPAGAPPAPVAQQAPQPPQQQPQQAWQQPQQAQPPAQPPQQEQPPAWQQPAQQPVQQPVQQQPAQQQPAQAPAEQQPQQQGNVAPPWAAQQPAQPAAGSPPPWAQQPQG